MTTLLTGASGFIGSWIARTLAPAPGTLRVLARPGSDLSLLEGLSVEVAEGDLLDPPSLRRALEGVSRVYHVAGLRRFHPRDAEIVRQVNFEGTMNLFEAALSAGVGRIVYTASIFALGRAESPEHPADEDTDFNAEDLLNIPYIRAKRDSEIVAQAYIAQGLPLIRLYPGLCLGPGDRNRSSSGAIDAWLHGQLPGVITGGGICLMDVRDAAAAHIAAMERGVPGRRYLATGHNVTLTGLFERLSHITGKPAPRLRFPPWLGIPAAHLTESLGIFPALDSAQARLMACYWWYDSARAQKELNIRFRPLEDTLREAVNWLRANPA
jgi:dihydroflavonol-4-reductase